MSERDTEAERIKALKEFLAPRLNNQDFWFALKVAFGVTAKRPVEMGDPPNPKDQPMLK
jgi:hypothetical protein